MSETSDLPGMWEPADLSGGWADSDDSRCRLGYEEHDGYAYCYAHGRFIAYAAGSRTCHDTAARRKPQGE